MERAHKDKKMRGYHYKGYYFHKPEGCKNWNIYDITDGAINFGHPICHPRNYSECKYTIDDIIDSL